MKGRWEMGQQGGKVLEVSTLLVTLALAVLWVFPRYWYTHPASGQRWVWLVGTNQTAGWRFRARPLGEAAEAALEADRFVNGEFVGKEGAIVRVFCAEVLGAGGTAAIFAHTPDRCWTGVGWELERAGPERVVIDVGGVWAPFERRLFEVGGRRELVYFTAVVDGEPLPYRLDQFYEVGLRRAGRLGTLPFGKMLSALSGRFFIWPWKVFASRRSLTGRKQFIRVSTPVSGEPVDRAEARLKGFVVQWLRPRFEGGRG